MKKLIINIIQVFLLILFIAFLVVYSPIAMLSSLVRVIDNLIIDLGEIFFGIISNLLDWLIFKINE